MSTLHEFKPGDDCYVLADSRRGSWSRVSAKRTVDRVTKTLVILDDGSRFSRDRLSIRHGGAWDMWFEYLVAPDDSRLAAARASAANRKARIGKLADELDSLCRSEKWNEALSLARDLVDKLTEQVKP